MQETIKICEDVCIWNICKNVFFIAYEISSYALCYQRFTPTLHRPKRKMRQNPIKN